MNGREARCWPRPKALVASKEQSFGNRGKVLASALPRGRCVLLEALGAGKDCSNLAFSDQMKRISRPPDIDAPSPAELKSLVVMLFKEAAELRQSRRCATRSPG